mgnify:CR=1 FL=1
MNKFFIIVVFCLFTNLLFAQDSEISLIDIKGSSRLVCEIDFNKGNYLRKYFSEDRSLGYDIVRFKRTISNLQSKINNLYQSRSNLSNERVIKRLDSRINNLTRIIRQLTNCQKMQKKFFNPFGSLSDDPVVACQIVGNSSQALTVAPIINGRQCIAGNSSVLSLYLYSGNSFQGSCTGTLVAKRVILTAGHCIEGVTDIDIETQGGIINSGNLFLHPDYDKSDILEKNDIALIKTNKDVPARITQVLSSSLYKNEKAIIAGFGLDENDNSGRLKAVFVRIAKFNTGSISTKYPTGDTLYGNTCRGDSGGPILVLRSGKWRLAGVTSNGRLTNCGSGDTAFYANILDPSNRSFINSVASGILD